METLTLYSIHKHSEQVKHYIDNTIFKDENTDFVIISNYSYKDVSFDCPVPIMSNTKKR